MEILPLLPTAKASRRPGWFPLWRLRPEGGKGAEIVHHQKDESRGCHPGLHCN